VIRDKVLAYAQPDTQTGVPLHSHDRKRSLHAIDLPGAPKSEAHTARRLQLARPHRLQGMGPVAGLRPPDAIALGFTLAWLRPGVAVTNSPNLAPMGCGEAHIRS
jgi:hypothetical protein